MNFLTFLPHYILLLLEISITLFVLIIIVWWIWQKLIDKEVEEWRVQQNAT
jgi:hypothetical protein